MALAEAVEGGGAVDAAAEAVVLLLVVLGLTLIQFGLLREKGGRS